MVREGEERGEERITAKEMCVCVWVRVRACERDNFKVDLMNICPCLSIFPMAYAVLDLSYTSLTPPPLSHVKHAHIHTPVVV
jgi:hypothetical protein